MISYLLGLWTRGNQRSLDPIDVASILSNTSNGDHPVAKTLACVLSFTS